jgi:hypothetical protein
MSPIPLEQSEQVIFQDIVEHREAATWSRNDLRIAANLAKCYRRLEELNENIDRVGYTTRNDRGTLVGNPEVNIMLQVIMSVDRLNKILGLSASQKGLGNEAQRERNAQDRKNREKSVDDEDGLI